MLAAHESGDRVAQLEPVAAAADVLAAQDAARRVRASEPLRRYIVALLHHTRTDPRVELGGSPRAGLLLLRAAKARALLAGRDHAIPDDVQSMSQSVLAHRIVLARMPTRRPASASSPTRWPRRRPCNTWALHAAGRPTSAPRARHRPAGGRVRADRGARRRRAALGAGRHACADGRRQRRLVGFGARGVRVQRTLGARRVMEDEPVAILIEVHAGRLGLPPARIADPLLAAPVALRDGARGGRLRIEARFGRADAACSCCRGCSSATRSAWRRAR